MEKTPAAPPDSRRAGERSREMLLVSYTILPDLPAEYTETYDIAIGGLAMLTNAALNTELKISIELELRNNTRPKLRLTGIVRWSTYDPLLRKYRTGVAFADRSPAFESELLHYIDTLHEIRNLRL